MDRFPETNTFEDIDHARWIISKRKAVCYLIFLFIKCTSDLPP